MTIEDVLELLARIEVDEAAVNGAVQSIDFRTLRGPRSQEAIATAAGLSQAAICRLEAGRLGLSRETLARVLRVYLNKESDCAA